MHMIKKGGRVSLFNYNPSIAGGKIAIKRFHLGRPMRNWQEKHLVSMIGAQGQGLTAPGVHGKGLGDSHGKSIKEGRKRILDQIGAQMSKRMKA
jgi:hypothetical protein